ncbi:hypothetical protein D0T53_09205 [Dysgonomonas sp. 216]|uniref:hypothetical protein n=1 Tax=Dysgonomonas sp. 216 TaxID=2302934 RepID=UPI0013D7286A|nr:hypothetical protein [Dysgonomonas sp. 216]NDW19089.1 hypothetical protein [Dysgonomonas sp. 216]
MNEATEKRQQPIVSVQDSSTPDKKKETKVTIDGVFGKIVIFEREDLTDVEICRLLNVASFTKLDIDKHYEREGGVDKHRYTVYNILI